MAVFQYLCAIHNIIEGNNLHRIRLSTHQYNDSTNNILQRFSPICIRLSTMNASIAARPLDSRHFNLAFTLLAAVSASEESIQNDSHQNTVVGARYFKKMHSYHPC